MRTSAFAATFLGFATLISSATADDDFSALLADLTFSDAPAPAQPLAVVPEEPAEELKPVPKFALPDSAEVAVDMFGMLESEIDSVEDPRPSVALQDPVPTRPAPAVPTVDFNSAFELQAPLQPVPGQVAGHRLHGIGGGCEGACAPTTNCDPGIICRPRSRVNLPTSSLHQYFRSDPCYTNLWDGYQRKCRHHDHIHGTCDCFTERHRGNCGEVIDCVPANCASCDASCD